MALRTASRGMWVFVLIWFGQLISLIGSGLTSFALGVWVYETTDSATSYALVILATMAPGILLSPLAGTLVDRWDRRWAMILSDIGAGLSTLIIFLLFTSGQFELWHILMATAASSAFGAFQWPAYSAATTLLVPKEHYGRANGIVQLGQAIAYIASPALAGFLVVQIQIQGVVLIDFATFAFAVLTLLFVRIPSPETTAEREVGKASFLREAAYGWAYLTARPGLLGMLTLFALLNFLLGVVMALFTPMVLSFTDADVLGTMTSIGASGMLFGGLVMSIWGGPKCRIHGMLGFLLLAGLTISVSGLRPSVPLVTAAAFGFFFCFPIVSASSDAIWQSKVAPDVQGRVFATRSMVAMSTMPLAYILAGPLADGVFEPLLATGGSLAGSIGPVIGGGQGRGIGLMFMLMGMLTMLATVGGYLHPRIRLVEDELPDVIAGEILTASDRREDGCYDRRLPDPIVGSEASAL
jgi:DHA3 family macrolide efflux protein-like MFS transporter